MIADRRSDPRSPIDDENRNQSRRRGVPFIQPVRSFTWEHSSYATSATAQLWCNFDTVRTCWEFTPLFHSTRWITVSVCRCRQWDSRSSQYLYVSFCFLSSSASRSETIFPTDFVALNFKSDVNSTSSLGVALIRCIAFMDFLGFLCSRARDCAVDLTFLGSRFVFISCDIMNSLRAIFGGASEFCPNSRFLVTVQTRWAQFLVGDKFTRFSWDRRLELNFPLFSSHLRVLGHCWGIAGEGNTSSRTWDISP